MGSETTQGALGPTQRWSARRKRDVVLRIFWDTSGKTWNNRRFMVKATARYGHGSNRGRAFEFRAKVRTIFCLPIVVRKGRRNSMPARSSQTDRMSCGAPTRPGCSQWKTDTHGSSLRWSIGMPNVWVGMYANEVIGLQPWSRF